MSTEQWLLLTDYSSKHRISVSTLRRRIKNNQIPYRFEGGKYYIVEGSEMSAESFNPRAAAYGFEGLSSSAEQQTFAAEPAPTRANYHPHNPAVSATTPTLSEDPEPLITTATHLLNELKRAYSNILLEKEEQMIQLKEEVSDLKTLVRVLEEETDRLRRQIAMYQKQ